jgi:hypothetical protein
VTTYPPAPLLYQNNLALDNSHSQLAYVGYDGTIFHLSGPFAPVLGAQSGAVCGPLAHLDPPFKHLDNKGARQDGTTWYDTLYDPAEYTMTVALGGMSPADFRSVMRSWLGAWDPKQLGKLCWFSPERGEWYANVRMSKAIPDQFKQDWYSSNMITFTWTARNDTAFWQGVDSVCDYQVDSSTITEDFSYVNPVGLSPNWTQFSTTGGGFIESTGTAAQWVPSGNNTGCTICQYTGTDETSGFSDNQMVSVKFETAMPAPTPYVEFTHNFGSDSNSSTLPNTSWNETTTTLSGSPTGTYGVQGGLATAISGGTGVQKMVARYASPTLTDDQTVSCTYSGSTEAAGSSITLCARMNSTADTYVYATIGLGEVSIGFVNSGTPGLFNHWLTYSIFGIPLPWGTWATEGAAPFTFQPGTYSLSCSGNVFTVLCNGTAIAQAIDQQGQSHVGSSYRYAGIGAVWVDDPSTPALPPAISLFTLADTAPSYVDIWGRMNTSGTTGHYGLRARIGYGTVLLSAFNAGTQYDLILAPCGPPKAGDVFTLQCGVSNPTQAKLEEIFQGSNLNPYQFQVYQNGYPLLAPIVTGILSDIIQNIENFFGGNFGYIDTNHYSVYGPGYRGWGFGMQAGGVGSGQTNMPTLSFWSGGADTGYITLTNIGDQEAWPRYLCYGPGTFLIGDSNTGNLISFGPLLPGQVALLNTLPRLPGVVDVTPPATSSPQAGLLQVIEKDVAGTLEALINFATNNNVPPLLQQFESFFGIVPPQGSLYSLLSGRFTTPLPPMLEQEGAPANTVHIPCQIQGGSSTSRIVAAVTPLRRWPE